MQNLEFDIISCYKYYYLENYPDVFEFIKNTATDIAELQMNLFEIMNKEDVCKKILGGLLWEILEMQKEEY